MLAWERWNIIGALVLISAGALLAMFVDFGRVRPTPDNQSAFFKAFNPHATIAHFQLGTGGSQMVGESFGSEYAAATHARTFEEHFFVRNGEQFAIDEALRVAIRALLKNTHATILNESITPSGGVLFHYVNGHTTGSVSLGPTSISTARRNDTPANGIDVQTRVTIDEKWTKN